MRNLMFVAALAALTAACNQGEFPVGAPSADTDEATAETPAEAQVPAPITVQYLTASQVESYWWDSANIGHYNFRGGVAILSTTGGSSWIYGSYVIVSSCADRTANPDGRAFVFESDACFDFVSLEGDQLTLNAFQAGATQSEPWVYTRVSGDTARELEAERNRRLQPSGQ